MPEYTVVLPIAGSISVIVQAENEDDAQAIALDSWPFKPESVLFEFQPAPNVLDAWVNELEVYEKIAEGNVLYVNCNSITVEPE